MKLQETMPKEMQKLSRLLLGTVQPAHCERGNISRGSYKGSGKKADDFKEKLDSAQTTYHIRRSRTSVGCCIYKVQYTTAERFKKIVQVVDMAHGNRRK